MKQSAVVFHAAPTSRPAPATGLAAASVLLAWMLSGCMSMSGLSGSSSYACKAPDGSYWALQSWQRMLPNLGYAPWKKLQRARELHPGVQFGPDFPSRFRAGGEPAAAAPAGDGGATVLQRARTSHARFSAMPQKTRDAIGCSLAEWLRNDSDGPEGLKGEA